MLGEVYVKSIVFIGVQFVVVYHMSEDCEQGYRTLGGVLSWPCRFLAHHDIQYL